MFLPSQLLEISQRLQPDVEDLQVLLQEEGLSVPSADALPELAIRLQSDPRFRRDVSFLVRSMLNREPEELGSMDVLGVLVVAAAGTRQDLGPFQTQLRDLLRFVMQQRRPLSRPVPAERTQTPAVIPAPPQTPEPEPAAPARAVFEPPATETRKRPPVPIPFTARYSTEPELEPEPARRGAHAGWIIAVLALLAGFGAGFFVWRNGPETKKPAATQLAAASPTNPPAAEPVRGATTPPVPTSRKSWRKEKNSRKPSPALPRAIGRRAEPPQVAPSESPQAAPPVAVAANPPPQIEPKVYGSFKAAQTANPNPAQRPALSNAAQLPPAGHRDTALASPPVNPARQPTAVGPGSGGNPFAHPEAADSAQPSPAPPSQVPSHRKEPVLIARTAPTSPPAAGARPQPEGTVHLGTAGNMASNLMYSPEPEYPAGAIQAGVQGEVTVRAVVGPNGNVIDARVVSGPPLLRDAALEAVERWRYRPYEQDGKPIAIATTAILDFQIPPRP